MGSSSIRLEDRDDWRGRRHVLDVMSQMAFEIGWHAQQAGGLWTLDVDELSRDLRRNLHTKDGDYRVPLQLVRQRLAAEHLDPPRQPATRHPWPAAVAPRRVVERIRHEYARGRGLAEIARQLNEGGIPRRTKGASGGHPRSAPLCPLHAAVARRRPATGQRTESVGRGRQHLADPHV
jgi:hypothetical protein